MENRSDRSTPPIDTRIYSNRPIYGALIGFAAGAVLLGVTGWAYGSGIIGIAGMGQFVASGAAVTTFVGTGIGGAAGGFLGALIALITMPARHDARSSKS